MKIPFVIIHTEAFFIDKKDEKIAEDYQLLLE